MGVGSIAQPAPVEQAGQTEIQLTTVLLLVTPLPLRLHGHISQTTLRVNLERIICQVVGQSSPPRLRTPQRKRLRDIQELVTELLTVNVHKAQPVKLQHNRQRPHLKLPSHQYLALSVRRDTRLIELRQKRTREHATL